MSGAFAGVTGVIEDGVTAVDETTDCDATSCPYETHPRMEPAKTLLAKTDRNRRIISPRADILTLPFDAKSGCKVVIPLGKIFG